MKQTILRLKSQMTHSFSALLPYLKKTRIFVGCIIAFIFLIFALLLSIFDARFIEILPYRQNIEVLSYADGLHVSIDEAVLDQVIPAQKFQNLSTSVDGSVAAFLTDAKELFIVETHKLKKIANNVSHFEISSSGIGVAFAQKYGGLDTLSLYYANKESIIEITTSLSRFDFSLSPDGMTVAYYTRTEDDETLMCYRKGRYLEISSGEVDLVGLSFDGKFVYAVCNTAKGAAVLTSYNRNGKATELGFVTSTSFKFNYNHQQIMFYNNGNTLVSTNGQPAVIVSSHPLYLVTVLNSQSTSDGNAITLPVRSLYNHIYTCSDGESTSAWMIRKNPQKSQKLISHVSGCTLDTSAKYLYFIKDHSQLCVMNISHGISRTKILADHADTYAVTSNRNKIYYADDGSLYCINRNQAGAPILITSHFSGYNLVVGASNSLYYLHENSVYTYRNGNEADRVAQNIKSIYNSSNNVVYLLGEDTIYIANTKVQPIKILGSD